MIVFTDLHHCDLRTALAAQLDRIARDPDQGSEFAELTRKFQDLPKGMLVNVLVESGYDCVCAINHDRVEGYVAFQKHSLLEWHVFSVRVLNGPGNRLGTRMVTFFVEQAYVHNVQRVRLWGEDRKQELSSREVLKMRKIFGRISTNQHGLDDIVVEACSGGYIEFRRPAQIVHLRRPEEPAQVTVAA